MTLTARYSPDVQQDINERIEYFESRSDSVADRFRKAVEETVRMLCGSPNMGERFRGDPTGTVRYRSVLKFRNYLIFYRQEGMDLQVLRILHGAMDYDNLFD